MNLLKMPFGLSDGLDGLNLNLSLGKTLSGQIQANV